MSAPRSSDEMRSAYASSRCNTSRMTGVHFHGWGTDLLVEKRTVEAWQAFSAVMKKHDYRFREKAGGTYNCRPISGTSDWSLHAYGLAIDLNPARNPHRTSTTNQPKAFRDDVKAIATNNGRQVFAWGGDWAGSSIDTMHWQVGATPAELATGLKDQEDDMTAEEKARLRAVEKMLDRLNNIPGARYSPDVDAEVRRRYPAGRVGRHIYRWGLGYASAIDHKDLKVALDKAGVNYGTVVNAGDVAQFLKTAPPA
jgi:hypothetical protein